MRTRFVYGLAVLAGFAALAFADEPKHPLAGAKGGEWVLAKTTTTTGGGEPKIGWLYRWVSKVEGTKVTVMVQPMKTDKLGSMAAAATHHDSSVKPDAPGKDARVSDDEVEVNGKKLKCKKIETKKDDRTSTKWTSSEIPISNEAKVVEKDKDGKELVKIETVDYGLTGGAERPLK
ncbi:hypothetical protein HY251_02060 [bacterium]|nr:hypothetical protein [bacterium]